MSNTSSADLVAAFLAKGKKITKVAPDATCGMTARDFYKAARDPINKVDPTEQRIEVAGGIQNGLGEWIYQD